LLLLAIVTGTGIYAIDWPIPDIVPERNFAQNDGGAPLLGMSFVSEGPIYAAEQGETVFARSTGERVSGLPSPLGSWIAVDLGDGLVNIYARYAESAEYLSAHIEKQQIIAQSGKSGANDKNGFYFSFFDRKEHRWINPATVILNPFPDTRPPAIGAVRLQNSDGGMVNIAQTRTIKQGRYAIFVETSDTYDGGAQPLAPNSIASFVNGTEAGILVFENFSARNGLLMVYRNTLLSANRIYAVPNAYEAGEFWFPRGIAILELIVGDRAGNISTASYRLVIE
ncbi:MAG: M23 family metallopeptidase, partial [Spirochaetaceae bacterium]|nr:M23 family metallopeptidase [Spirochaetaceae bacterium]